MLTDCLNSTKDGAAYGINNREFYYINCGVVIKWNILCLFPVDVSGESLKIYQSVVKVGKEYFINCLYSAISSF